MKPPMVNGSPVFPSDLEGGVCRLCKQTVPLTVSTGFYWEGNFYRNGATRQGLCEQCKPAEYRRLAEQRRLRKQRRIEQDRTTIERRLREFVESRT